MGRFFGRSKEVLKSLAACYLWFYGPRSLNCSMDLCGFCDYPAVRLAGCMLTVAGGLPFGGFSDERRSLRRFHVEIIHCNQN